jgi:hypothetical protein
MMTRIATRLAVALLLTAATTGLALAAKPQAPPEQQAATDRLPLEQGPSQDQQAPTAQDEKRECVANHSDFTANKTFVIEVTNTCEQRFRCTLRAYIVNAAGPSQGETTLTLEPASKGTQARSVYVIKLKESYGEAHSSQSCEEL